MEKTYTIERSRWGYGENGGFLRNADGLQCCLGFVCEQAGVKKLSVCYPYEAIGVRMGNSYRDGYLPPEEGIPDALKPFIRQIDADRLTNSALARDLAELNDQVTALTQVDAHTDQVFRRPPPATRAEREQRLIDRAAQDGITFVFVD